MKLTLQDKVVLVLAALWFLFFFFIMSTMVDSDTTPAKYLFRTALLTFSVPLFVLWLTGTLKRITLWFKERGNEPEVS